MDGGVGEREEGAIFAGRRWVSSRDKVGVLEVDGVRLEEWWRFLPDDDERKRPRSPKAGWGKRSGGEGRLT